MWFFVGFESVDNIYDIGGKQYGRITLPNIQGVRIPSFRGHKIYYLIMKDQNKIKVCEYLFLFLASVDSIYDIGGKQYGRITLPNIQGMRIPFFRGCK